MTSEATWADKSRTVSDDRSRLSGTETEVSGFGKNTRAASRRPDMPFRPKTAGAGRREAIDIADASLAESPIKIYLWEIPLNSHDLAANLRCALLAL